MGWEKCSLKSRNSCFNSSVVMRSAMTTPRSSDFVLTDMPQTNKCLISDVEVSWRVVSRVVWHTQWLVMRHLGAVHDHHNKSLACQNFCVTCPMSSFNWFLGTDQYLWRETGCGVHKQTKCDVNKSSNIGKYVEQLNWSYIWQLKR